jgi:long-subunit fatty acid transport protein
VPLELLQLQPGESISDLYAYLGENEGVAAQNAFLGYQGFIIDPVNDDDPQNTGYFSNIASGRFNHEYAYLAEGANNKLTVNFGTQISDNFFFGINVNTHSIDYEQSTLLFESNSNPGSSISQVGFENNLLVSGAGISAQLGAIVKIQEHLRIGLSLDSPAWFDIAEETTQYLESRRTVDGEVIVETINPRVVNIFETYYLRTPGKVTASAAYIFGTQGLLSLDYSYKDYGTIRFDDYNSNSYFSTVNASIDNSLTGVSSVRLGGEYRIKQLSLRGGLQYEESPYQNKTIVGDLSGFSLGLGYNYGNYSFDISYARAEQERKQQLYSIGLTDSTKIDTINSAIAFTLGFKF